MTKGKFILVNGAFVAAEEYRISIEESECTGFSEQFRAIKTVLPFFDETLETIKLKFLLLNNDYKEFTENKGAVLKRQIERTLTKNKHFLGAIVTLSFKFSGTKVNYTIQSETTESAGFDLNEKGLFTEIFDKIQKPASSLSTISLGSAPYWEIAEQYRDKSKLDEYLLISTSNSILEVPHSNIYLINGKSVLGAPETIGAYEDITKTLIIRIFNDLNLSYSESIEITYDIINSAEEIFAVDAIRGIRWIIGIGGKRYFNNTVRKINELFKQYTVS
jgi:branched-subunit amino acid aminotransferase/4-amino-4-deoxychorismate lyase